MIEHALGWCLGNNTPTSDGEWQLMNTIPELRLAYLSSSAPESDNRDEQQPRLLRGLMFGNLHLQCPRKDRMLDLSARHGAYRWPGKGMKGPQVQRSASQPGCPASTTSFWLLRKGRRAGVLRPCPASTLTSSCVSLPICLPALTSPSAAASPLPLPQVRMAITLIFE